MGSTVDSQVLVRFHATSVLVATELRAHWQRQASRNLALVHRDAFVFTTGRKSSNPQNLRNVLRAVHEAGDAVGLNGTVTRDDTGRVTREREPVGLHDLRHSFVPIALASGMRLPEASALARHANPLITAKAYAVLTDDARAKLGGKLANAFAKH